MSTVKLKPGDRVRLTHENLDGVVVEVKTRSVVVRVPEPSGKNREHHVDPDDLERLPTTKEAVLEVPRAQPVPVMKFTVDAARWITVDDAHVRDDRVDAWLTSLRTMYSELGSDGVLQSIALVGFHRRRVLTISMTTGHTVFHKMQNAWDAYKMRAERHDVPEHRTLDLFHLVHVSGNAWLAAEPAFAYGFVSVTSPPAEMAPFTASAKTFLDRRSASGLEGGALLANDEDGREVLFTRWTGREAAQAFIDDVRQHVVLAPTQHLGDEAEVYETVASVLP